MVPPFIVRNTGSITFDHTDIDIFVGHPNESIFGAQEN